MGLGCVLCGCLLGMQKNVESHSLVFGAGVIQGIECEFDCCGAGVIHGIDCEIDMYVCVSECVCVCVCVLLVVVGVAGVGIAVFAVVAAVCSWFSA